MTLSTVSSGAPVLVLDRVSKAFPAGRRRVDALREVSLQVRGGVVTGLIGPDGAGKTTLMRLAAALLTPDAGVVRVLGMDAAAQPTSVQAAVGYMPQRFGLYEDLTVQENLDLYADLQGVVPSDRPERYRELLHMADLNPFTRRLAGQLSGGMKQKLGLACALIRRPRLLLLDEPTVGVDPVSRRDLWAIIARLVGEESMTVMLSTAYLDEAERCDEVLLMHQGQLLEQGPPSRLSAAMAGRGFEVAVPEGTARRHQAALINAPGVLDALVEGDRVRLVMAKGADPGQALEGRGGLEAQPVPPRLEDGFVATLRGQAIAERPRRARQPQTPRQAAGSGNVIEVQGVARRFGEFYAVRDLSFAVRRGEVFGLLGANGAGKSTTFRMLCGLLPASAGLLRVAGVDLRKAPAAARQHIGYMSQKFSLYGNLSVAENLGFFASAYGLSAPRARERIGAALEDFELGGQADSASADLPLGYKQRLALACALLHEPEILFLDEPTSGVDPLARREFWQRINALAEAGVTVMVTTHFMGEAEYCDRLAIMAAGGILAIGSPTQIRERAATAECPRPTMEDAFIHLITAPEATGA